MKQLKFIYQKYNNLFVSVLFPLILLLYPFLTVNQGVDVSDSTYSLSNFLFFDRMEGMWVVSTYVANVFGWILTHLPLGTTLLGMNIYTTLLVSGTVLFTYYMLRKWMPAWIVFVGELAAVGFCWIPTGILYNYLTYFFFTLGAILLYRGLVEEKNLYLIAAGVSLGVNVFVRIPNLTEMALIVGLWYYLWSQKRTFAQICQKTGFCLTGYAAGVLIPLLGALFQYGMDGIIDMIAGLASVQSSDNTYSIWSMITSVIDAYSRTFKWVLVIGIGVAMGMAMFACLKGKYENIKKFIYIVGMLVLLRFLWGRGMFSFRYYEDYSSMYEWGMIGLYLAWVACIYMLASIKNSPEEKLWAIITLVILIITPLGSNNYTFQNLNNLFIIAPFVLYTFVKLYRRRDGKSVLSGLSYPWKAMVVMLGTMIFVQSIGFHSQFVFRDGMDGSKRNYVFSEPGTVAAMHTTQSNGKALTGLMEYVKEQGIQDKEVLLYGDCPGISFLLDMPFAIGTAWPDLESYAYDIFVNDIESLEIVPVVIIRNVENVGEQSIDKKEYLNEFLRKNQYTNVYNNGVYAVYTTQNDTLK